MSEQDPEMEQPSSQEQMVHLTPELQQASKALSEMLARQRAATPASAAPQSATPSEDSVIANLMNRHPGLTREEAVRHLEAYGD